MPIWQGWQINFNFNTDSHLLPVVPSGHLCWERFWTMFVINFVVCHGCRTEKWGTQAMYLLFSNEDIINKVKLYFATLQRTCVKSFICFINEETRKMSSHFKESHEMKHWYILHIGVYQQLHPKTNKRSQNLKKKIILDIKLVNIIYVN